MKKQINLMNRLTEEGLQLRIQVEQKFLNRLIEDVPSDETTLEQVCKALLAYCDLIKQDIAAEKNEVVSNRIPNASRSQVGVSQKMDQTGRAPYGVNNEGTPLSLAEFRNAVARPIAGLYGLSDPEPNAEGARSSTNQGLNKPMPQNRKAFSDNQLNEDDTPDQQSATNRTG